MCGNGRELKEVKTKREKPKKKKKCPATSSLVATKFLALWLDAFAYI
jgi:hypothetical protein